MGTAQKMNYKAANVLFSI